ncbi:glycerophosphoryl diester phosphodiesterase [Metallosphaera yellowstonensis MK1]|uniref:Glycerophosphoryl diester phosphodiesterase n=1 Tax=Metallosphaera yellowstonensis MK1 TaxID=671065 RepID=H2C1U3_9CREN|nr:glycerophosphodiester phosphodiesterase family protein [Metallosphaera yellowstonensis]EHP70214.1 glycerophosphoryl diester phosphodiesterase [Metallosphaera yellowstonensis MK1]
MFKIPMIVGHRGAPLEAPENSIPSFILAKQIGASAIELDVHLSKDGVPVVIHDSIVVNDDGSKRKINEMYLEEIRKVNLAHLYHGKYSDVRIPTLRDVFNEVGRIKYCIEIKKSYKIYPNIEGKVLDIVDSLGLRDYVEITSNDYDSVLKIRELDPDIVVGMGYLGKVKWILDIAKRLEVNWLHVQYDLISEEDVELVHDEGMKINAWTVNDVFVANELANYGVDAITTDDPRLLIGELSKTCNKAPR